MLQYLPYPAPGEQYPPSQITYCSDPVCCDATCSGGFYHSAHTRTYPTAAQFPQPSYAVSFPGPIYGTPASPSHLSTGAAPAAWAPQCYIDARNLPSGYSPPAPPPLPSPLLAQQVINDAAPPRQNVGGFLPFGMLSPLLLGPDAASKNGSPDIGRCELGGAQPDTPKPSVQKASSCCSSFPQGEPPSKAQRKNIVVIGGSYAGAHAIDLLAPLVHKTHRIVLVEKSSHIPQVSAFPRISVVPGFEHKAFVPFRDAFHQAPKDSVTIVQGVAASVLPERVVLADGRVVEYEYLVVATGTGRTPLTVEGKAEGVERKRELQERIKNGQDIVIVGGGPYGLAMAFDAKELYPRKSVTVVHSHPRLMPQFHPELHNILMTRAHALGVRILLNTRADVPRDGFPTHGMRFGVSLTDGSVLPADVALACFSGSPLSAPLSSLSPGSIHPLNKEILVQPTMQLLDARFPRVFAVGDVAATSAPKAVGPAQEQAAVAVQNILQMIGGSQNTPTTYAPTKEKIRVPLGLYSYVLFQDPEKEDGCPSMSFVNMVDGTHDEAEIMHWFECRLKKAWDRRAPGVTDYYS
ncbi:FAD/NAD(P)-binding domain-containing protein [Mycena kentingensis (nom. inval.)]|nr:FAD/NAD(P)-binding domain-containing protein [Mycena kentingensis (nom. inval.)]